MPCSRSPSNYLTKFVSVCHHNTRPSDTSAELRTSQSVVYAVGQKVSLAVKVYRLANSYSEIGRRHYQGRVPLFLEAFVV